jgi:transglutaminase-like putative cysteine protease
MRLHIIHSTTYRYDEPVPYSLQELRLIPASGPTQDVVSWETSMEGATRQVLFEDQFTNRVELIRVDAGQTEIHVRAEGEVDTTDTAGIVGPQQGFAPLWLFRRSTSLTMAGTGVDRLIDGLRTQEPSVDRLHELSNRISKVVVYVTGTTSVDATAEHVLEVGTGVCQDHAHVFLAAARLLGHPARYVSGYLMMDDRIEQDATHAWAEVWVDPLGWIGFDISNGISPDERYVRVATGLDYSDAAPVSGIRFGDGSEDLTVSVQVQQQ